MLPTPAAMPVPLPCSHCPHCHDFATKASGMQAERACACMHPWARACVHVCVRACLRVRAFAAPWCHGFGAAAAVLGRGSNLAFDAAHHPSSTAGDSSECPYHHRAVTLAQHNGAQHSTARHSSAQLRNRPRLACWFDFSLASLKSGQAASSPTRAAVTPAATAAASASWLGPGSAHPAAAKSARIGRSS